MSSITSALYPATASAKPQSAATDSAPFLLPQEEASAPAKPAATGTILQGGGALITQEDAITAGYNAWRAGLSLPDLPQEYIDSLNATRDTYLNVLTRAQETGALENPQAFLKTLNTQELEALQHHNSLADPIRPEDVSHEGAYNLLQLPNKKTDINRDGLLTTGIGHGITFPPADAPPDVLAAWEKATAGMDLGTKMIMQLSMWMHANGGPDIKEGTTARYYAEDFDWIDFATRMVEGAIENQKYQTTDIQKEYGKRMLAGYQRFLDYLNN